MRLAADEQHLITCSLDGGVLVWRVDGDGVAGGMARGVKKDVAYSEEVLVDRMDYEELNSSLEDLRKRLLDLKAGNDYQLRMLEAGNQEKINDLTEKYLQEMNNLKNKIQNQKQEREKFEKRIKDELKELIDRHEEETRDMEQRNNQKLMTEYEKYQELQNKSQRMQEEYERKIFSIEKDREKRLHELTEYHEEKLKNMAIEIEKLERKCEMLIREREEMVTQIEEDADREIVAVKTKLQSNVKEKVAAVDKMKGCQVSVMTKKFLSMQKEMDANKELIDKGKSEISNLNGTITNLEKTITGLKREIQERDDAILDKVAISMIMPTTKFAYLLTCLYIFFKLLKYIQLNEKRIYELKKLNEEAEKFKFVLDYRIHELKNQVQPKDDEIETKKDIMNNVGDDDEGDDDFDVKRCPGALNDDMELELGRYQKVTTQLETNLDNAKQRLSAAEKELQKERQKVHAVEMKVQSFKTDLHNCVGYIQDYKLLKSTIRAMYLKHVQDDMRDYVSEDADKKNDFARQRDHLEKTMVSLVKKHQRESNVQKTDNLRIMQDNINLIKEVNELRRELQISNVKIHDLEVAAKIRLRKNANASLTAATASNDIYKIGTSADEYKNADEATLRMEMMEKNKLLELQQEEMKKLRNILQQIELGHNSRPSSGQKLSPINGDKN
ncbi:hypothetical protein HELRODRAFT_77033 [Helobdella robusta]|uniref:Cilia- and flagella-associated protein 57 n=1 Tax=Helobdella robusta TaxID=6412 RepID=T1G2S5_HELRO|nr:hypothetical protein HELRODRAFT_77033 [Helobdella robusta]ESO06917.1 hypothetical protein HELRODRAFT_77033 [Helobdella robusta]